MLDYEEKNLKRANKNIGYGVAQVVVGGIGAGLVFKLATVSTWQPGFVYAAAGLFAADAALGLVQTGIGIAQCCFWCRGSDPAESRRLVTPSKSTPVMEV
ncbi:MAG TPA: hypothetical protein VGV92_08400 [Gammaproteobacteria bacterium]|nr:hypothetical protein [Gammaproteobacteria bacterium]